MDLADQAVGILRVNLARGVPCPNLLDTRAGGLDQFYDLLAGWWFRPQRSQVLYESVELCHKRVEIVVGFPRQVFPLFVVFQSAVLVYAFEAGDDGCEC